MPIADFYGLENGYTARAWGGRDDDDDDDSFTGYRKWDYFGYGSDVESWQIDSDGNLLEVDSDGNLLDFDSDGNLYDEDVR